ncbi:uncharacterized protein [Littorina saxatilis]|uniref:Uncharacterized protein n=1 Tax=Littorina saxatilis TaxID=31220 RepID=A0AAN9BSF1_9CAEN
MASTASSSKTAIPDAIFFELSPKIVLSVRLVNILTLLMVVITFIMCLIQGNKNATYYLLACNTVISAFVGIVVNWWYRGGDLGSEKFWYILMVAAVLVFQCITTDIYIFKVVEENTPAVTVSPVNSSTRVYPWHSFRTANKSTVHAPWTTPSSFY